MPDAHQDTVDAIVGRSLLAAESLADETRRRLVDRLAEVGTGSFTTDHMRETEARLEDFEPLLAQIFVTASLAAGLAGTALVFASLPRLAQHALAGEVPDPSLGGEPAGIFLPTGPPQPPGGPLSPFADLGPDEPIVRFPLIEDAARDLLGRNVVTRAEFDQMADEARRQAFTVAGEITTDTIDTVRNSLAETVQEGASLSRFKEKLGEDLEGSFLGPAHLENVYRTNIQSAFHRAHDELADNPVVREIFPYQEYLAIRDSRVRPEHLALESLGLSGTAVYRRDDPMWDLFTPPWDYQCRCGVNLLTVEAAARRGVEEARRWERTGQAPAEPEWRIDAIPFRPDPDFVSGRTRLSVVRFATAHAPKGGISIGGKQFKGGEFIPGDVLAKATDAERAAIKTKQTGGLTITPQEDRAFTGEPKPLKTKLTKAQTGAIGEQVAIEWLKSQGFADARTMNVDRNNFPVDLIQDHEVYEIKAGLISNGKDAQKWRLTIGEPGKKEKAWLKSASPEDKSAWNARKAEMIVDRKNKMVEEVSQLLGRPVKLKTLTIILDPDTQQADIHVFEGSHPIIRWRSPAAVEAYQQTVQYDQAEAAAA